MKCSKEGMHVKCQSREHIGKAFRVDVKLHKGGGALACFRKLIDAQNGQDGIQNTGMKMTQKLNAHWQW